MPALRLPSRPLLLACLVSAVVAVPYSPTAAASSPLDWTQPIIEAAREFCGFYVAGADAELYNNATMVVLMRDGTRTVLSMQNNYQGPAEDFAMVVPVPVVLQEKDVKVLPDDVFARVDKLAAPRLVEYWEQDPCAPPMEIYPSAPPSDVQYSAGGGGGQPKRDLGVTIEAKFAVGEYQVVILSAKDSTGLDTWLRQENYQIPQGAEPLLRPYVQSGSKFFVAKVDSKKVKRGANGQVMLSPLRFHYDSQEFALPVRLGLINAPDGQGAKQDLIVHILARNVRYATANYENVAIPTNLDVKNETREHFGEFYASLFDHVLANNPKAVVTEYAWAANSCDPCPEPPLTLEELVTLGADVLPTYAPLFGQGQRIDENYQWSIPGEFVLTRLHARYDSSSLGEDLVFEAAPAIVGGREFMSVDGQLERGAVEEPSGWNNFQARYIIRHAWEGPIECTNPQRGIWGGPWPSVQQAHTSPAVATDLAFAPRGGSLDSYVTEAAKMEIEHTVGKLPAGSVEPPPPDPRNPGIKGYEGEGCAHCSASDAGAGGLLAFGFGLLALLGLRRRQ